ncbi:uroporphyrinogen-III decarboxylase-like protein [bacterium]|nr:uroporphyrinogen-III decarboxylase-like protein [bacterium]
MSKSLWEPDFSRILTVLYRTGEPDRVPFFELFHDAEVLVGVMGGPPPSDPDAYRRWRLEFFTKLNYDYMNAYHTVSFPEVPTLLSDDTAAEQSRGQRGWEDEHHGPIGSWDDFERYQWPTVSDSDFADIEACAAILPDGMKVTVTLPGGVLENLIRLIGYEPLCYALVEQPDLVQAVVDKIGETELTMYRALCQFEHVGLVWLNDDLGFKTQTMIGPHHLRQYVFPWHQRLVQYAHDHGKPVVLHACGNLREVMEDLIEFCHFDAKHSFEDVIQPVAEFKHQYGTRISAMGGIDVDVLARLDEEQVRRYVRRTIEETAPGGGWALGSGNTLANYIPLRNFLAMLDEGRQAGVYTH